MARSPIEYSPETKRLLAALTGSQREFVLRCVALGGNKVRALMETTQARADAKRSYGAARVRAKKLADQPAVSAALAAVEQEHLDALSITAHEVLRELKRVAFSDLRRVVRWGPKGVKLRPSTALSDDDAAAVAEVSETVTQHGGTKRVRFHDKRGALELLARHLGLVGNGAEGEGGGNLIINFNFSPEGRRYDASPVRVIERDDGHGTNGHG